MKPYKSSFFLAFLPFLSQKKPFLPASNGWRFRWHRRPVAEENLFLDGDLQHLQIGDLGIACASRGIRWVKKNGWIFIIYIHI